MQDEENADMPNPDINEGQAGKVPSNVSANMPSGSSGGQHPAVAKHDHVMNIKNGN